MVKSILGMDWERRVLIMSHNCEVCGQCFGSSFEAEKHEQNCTNQLDVEQITTPL